MGSVRRAKIQARRSAAGTRSPDRAHRFPRGRGGVQSAELGRSPPISDAVNPVPDDFDGCLMRPAAIAKIAALLLALAFADANCFAQTLVDADFSRGDFAALGWKAKRDWDIFTYPQEAANNPGALARFAANKPAGSLTKTFDEVRNPAKLTFSLDYGWGWGDAGQAADMVA